MNVKNLPVSVCLVAQSLNHAGNYTVELLVELKLPVSIPLLDIKEVCSVEVWHAYTTANGGLVDFQPAKRWAVKPDEGLRMIVASLAKKELERGIKVSDLPKKVYPSKDKPAGEKTVGGKTAKELTLDALSKIPAAK